MKTLLRIDASARVTGSHSRALGDHYEELWMRANPGGSVVRRDVGREPVPHLDQGALENGGVAEGLIAELLAADEVIVTSPLYNFGVPSTLKAWVDQVVRSGRTFVVEGQRYRGLLGGRSVCFVTARGGRRESEGDVDQGPFLRSVFDLLGFERIEHVALEGTGEDEERVRAHVAEARVRIERLFHGPATLWVGEFSPADRADIERLRCRQVAAILAGDPDAYAELCTEDVLLLLQGRPPAGGRERFREVESELFRGTRFRSIRQLPLRVERQGGLAVEVGAQDVELEPGSVSRDAFRTRRKYVHVLRRTDAGWRFAVLTSNNSE